MGTSPQNHSAADHGDEATRKQLFRIAGERRIRSIHDDTDWALVHLKGRLLRCPVRGCPQGLDAKLSSLGRRFLANKRGTRCGHAAPQGGGGEMTEEHLWLQATTRQLCRSLGYDAELEVSGDGNRVDVLVDSGELFAIEVQRGDTDFAGRRRRREDEGRRTIWVIPGDARPKTTSAGQRGANPLFSEPSFRLGYADRPGRGAEWMPEEELRASVWNGGGGEVWLKAWVTVGSFERKSATFVSRSLDLEDFLHQVLSGSRRWDPRPLIEGGGGRPWRGWLLDADVDQFDAALRCAHDAERRASASQPELADWRDDVVAASLTAAGSSPSAEAIEPVPPFAATNGDASTNSWTERSGGQGVAESQCDTNDAREGADVPSEAFRVQDGAQRQSTSENEAVGVDARAPVAEDRKRSFLQRVWMFLVG